MFGRRRPSALARRGATSLQVLVILVPVLFAFMGFAVDLGRLYMIRSELQAAANAVALAAAQKLIGTDASLDDALAAAGRPQDNTEGFANRYDFAGITIGETTGELSSEIPAPTFHETVASAAGEGDSAGAEAGGGSTARHARVTVRADAPLLFWGFLRQGLERRTPVVVAAVAGHSAPLCTACGIEILAVAAPDSSEETDFGFVPGIRYTLGFGCTGGPTPAALGGTAGRIPYVILNRLNEEAEIFAEENTQLFRIGAQGMPASTVSARSCVSVNAAEQVWAGANPIGCNQNRIPSQVQALLCGLASRFESEVPGACSNIGEVETLAALYQPDTDLSDLEEYAAYAGNLRRVITVVVVDSLATPEAMTVLGFRQFLLSLPPTATSINVADTNGRFPALYIGGVVPLRQGRFDGCTIAAGPGKVVLHR